MKGSFLWKLMWLFCALAGCLAGYGIFYLMGTEEIPLEKSTKDNTLIRELSDSVFFDRKQEVQEDNIPSGVRPEIVPAASPTVEPVVEPTVPASDKSVSLPSAVEEVLPTGQPEGELLPTIAPADNTTAEEDGRMLPSLSEVLSSREHLWIEGMAGAGVSVSGLNAEQQADAAQQQAEKVPNQAETAEVITYPTKIFGQVPVINRSDAYVSYFEFCYDLVTMLEGKVEQRGLNMNALLAKFAIKALFCGIDIEKLDINAPIPRKEAALTLWLAAQILGEDGSDTSANTAQNYVTDLKGCSGSEKKAVAYLYEQGILSGYQTAGQNFYPELGLKTEAGAAWISRANQCWK